jgi:putative transposase
MGGLVSDPALYPWSSHLHYALGHSSKLITEHPVYLSLGPSALERSAAYHTDSALGTETFLNEAEAKLGRSVRLPVRGRPPKSVTEKLL